MRDNLLMPYFEDVIFAFLQENAPIFYFVQGGKNVFRFFGRATGPNAKLKLSVKMRALAIQHTPRENFENEKTRQHCGDFYNCI